MISTGFFKFKVKLIWFLGELIYKLGGYVSLEPYIYFTTAKIKIKEIEYYKKITRDNRDHRYRWERLKQDIVDNGLKRKIHVQFTYCGNQKYLHLVDGNHRIAILRELYGDDHIVTAKVFLPDPFDHFNKYSIQNIYGGRANPYDTFSHKLEKKCCKEKI